MNNDEQIIENESSFTMNVTSCRESSSRNKPNHPKDNIIDDVNEDIWLQKRVLNQLTFSFYVSVIERMEVEKALNDECLMNKMHEDLNQFIRNIVWFVVRRPFDNVLNKKWIFIIKYDQNEIVVRNKARLVLLFKDKLKLKE